jgi:fructose-1,6-bisphosphatase/inositol monophosphatase family enzyme
MQELSQISQLANQLTMYAGQKLVAGFDQIKSVLTKADHSFVTQFDTDIERYFVSEIKPAFPSHNIQGEEGSDVSNQSPFTWHLDPLDGTSNFILGIPLFGSMIAVTDQTEPIVSSVSNPLAQLDFLAVSDQPLQINGGLYQPPKELPLNQITVVCDSGKTKEGRVALLQFLENQLDKVRSVRLPGNVSNHLNPLASPQPTISIIMDAPGHDVMPIAFCFQKAGYTNLNRQGLPWSTKDHDLFSIPSYLTKNYRHYITNHFRA